jgi:hypothetical protein
MAQSNFVFGGATFQDEGYDVNAIDVYGVPEQTGPGWMFESLRLWDGNAQSPELRADDGGGNLMIDAPVPEPSLSVLAGLGVLALRLRSGARRSSRVGAGQ